MKAILSSTVVRPGTWEVKEVPMASVQFQGVTHFVGHPSTKALLESLGAVPSPSRQFDVDGLTVGESFLAVPLASNPRPEGWTAETAVEDVAQLRALLVTKVA